MEGFSCFIPTAPLPPLTSQTLTHEQKLMNLAKEAENAFDVLDIPPRTRHFFETGAINDLFEGHAPTAPGTSCPTTERLSARAAPSSACRRLRIWTSCSFP